MSEYFFFLQFDFCLSMMSVFQYYHHYHHATFVWFIALTDTHYTLRFLGAVIHPWLKSHPATRLQTRPTPQKRFE